MSGATNRGKVRELEWSYRARTIPTNFYVAFVTNATAPTADTNILSDLTEIAAGNGYSAGGIQLTPGVTDFDVVTEDDSGDLGQMEIKDLVVSASEGVIPSSGGGMAYAVLLDDNVTVGSREVIRYWDVRDGSNPRSITDGGSITWKDFTMQNKES